MSLIVKRYFFILCIFLLSNTVSGQFRVSFTDSITGLKITGLDYLSIVCNGIEQKAIYIHDTLFYNHYCNGTLTIYAFKKGYSTKKINLRASEKGFLNLALSPIAYDLKEITVSSVKKYETKGTNWGLIIHGKIAMEIVQLIPMHYRHGKLSYNEVRIAIKNNITDIFKQKDVGLVRLVCYYADSLKRPIKEIPLIKDNLTTIENNMLVFKLVESTDTISAQSHVFLGIKYTSNDGVGDSELLNFNIVKSQSNNHLYMRLDSSDTSKWFEIDNEEVKNKFPSLRLKIYF